MDERILKWIYDIDFALNEIDSYFDNKDKNFLEYRENTMLKRAIERDLEIIGEAVNRILKKDPSYANIISDAKAIIGLRNQVIHAYDSISDENIWSIIINHIPKLKKEIRKIIQENK
ncbi:HepT-like ribonuclease domain-containing protein [Flavicella sediminum]|uniref:HepT-like ribonuclease domain-containing protein n=1 Tax=Flavicella sediminum TaxID=2585141 RepID=UPI0011241929|nr:HepT-like ribonuclease domain-containing protein [Flavicella sediminum]